MIACNANRPRLTRGDVRKVKHGAIGLNKLQLKWISPPKDKGWAKLFIDVMDREAFRSLSITSRRVLDALIHHHFTCRQRENGNLQVSYSQFEAAGATRKLIAAAIRELVAAKFIETTQGSAQNHGMRRPLIYGLPIYPPNDEGRRFVWIPLAVLESSAWVNLSINARRIMDRLLIENGNHRSQKNGELRVSYGQFEGHGVALRFIKPALDDLAAAGLLDIIRPKGGGSRKPPNRYRIAFLGTVDGPATWRTEQDSAPSKSFSLVAKGTVGLGVKGEVEGAENRTKYRRCLGA